MKGRVRWYSVDKGYGYIKAENNQDILVKKEDILSSNVTFLTRNDLVEFDLFEGFRGPQAKKVVKRVWKCKCKL